jgi:hypothetical protein
MPFPIPTVDEVLVAGSLAGVPVTPEQAHAVIATVEHFESPESPCLGLNSWHVASANESMLYGPPLAGDSALVEVHFQYLHDDLEVSRPGLEVTVFNRDGSVHNSQDFG